MGKDTEKLYPFQQYEAEVKLGMYSIVGHFVLDASPKSTTELLTSVSEHTELSRPRAIAALIELIDDGTLGREYEEAGEEYIQVASGKVRSFRSAA